MIPLIMLRGLCVYTPFLILPGFCVVPLIQTGTQINFVGDHTFLVRAVDRAGNVGPGKPWLFTVGKMCSAPLSR